MAIVGVHAQPLSEVAEMMRTAQQNFLQNGGVFTAPLARMRAAGMIQPVGVFQEYPKMLYQEDGMETVDCSVVDIDKNTIKWKETRKKIRQIVVNSEEEEERVLSGGKTSEQLEEDRQTLIAQAAAAGIRVDRTWSITRLRREMGQKDPAPDGDELSVLRKRAAELQELLRLREEVATLTAQLSAPAAAPDETEDLRAQLVGLGITPDKRWGVPRLREELDRATAPAAA